MNSHNPKHDTIAKVAAVRIEADQDKVQVVKSNLLDVDQLTISDDDDLGSDPYNSTGEYVILKSKLDLAD